jgi:tRNA threonylcarbamoyl adenosine modification protein (Sua5/YciO/YrdC/YwlC family)
MTKPRTIPSQPVETALEQALAILERGGLVCVPTETVYGVGGRIDRPTAVAELRSLKPGERAFTLHVAAPSNIERLAIVPARARRLMRAFWPGPLTLVLDARPGTPELLAAAPGFHTLGFRAVDEPFTHELLRRVGVPLLLSSANRPGAEPAVTARDAMKAIGSEVDLCIDGGASPIGVASTVVRVDARGDLTIIRQGAIPARSIHERSAVLHLFVCSGNTCRSPMAAAIARQVIAERLGVPAGGLVALGFDVASAGVHAMEGMPASANAIEAAREIGLDLSEHRARRLDADLVARASRIWAMGPSHTLAAAEIFDEILPDCDPDAHPPELLGKDEPVEDPFGGDLDAYRAVRDQLERLIRARL